MGTKTQADIAWQMLAELVRNDVQADRVAQAWADMAKQSSQKKLMLQKQNKLRARMRCL